MKVTSVPLRPAPSASVYVLPSTPLSLKSRALQPKLQMLDAINAIAPLQEYSDELTCAEITCGAISNQRISPMPGPRRCADRDRPLCRTLSAPPDTPRYHARPWLCRRCRIRLRPHAGRPPTHRLLRRCRALENVRRRRRLRVPRAWRRPPMHPDWKLIDRTRSNTLLPL